MSTQNEGGLARLPVRYPLGALEGGLAGSCFEIFWILGGWASKWNSYQFLADLCEGRFPWYGVAVAIPMADVLLVLFLVFAEWSPRAKVVWVAALLRRGLARRLIGD